MRYFFATLWMLSPFDSASLTFLIVSTPNIPSVPPPQSLCTGGVSHICQGGSIFDADIFLTWVIFTCFFTITVVNRGTIPLKIPSIEEFRFDRHDVSFKDFLSKGPDYDVLIDCCAYEPGDCKNILEALDGKLGQFVFISSCSVFKPSPAPRDERSSLITTLRRTSGPVEEYSFNKLRLEAESIESCEKNGVAYTIIRPCMVYGPFNYAPRESYYFKLLQESSEIPVPVDSNAEFSMAYVADVAKALISCVCSDNAKNTCFNIASPERISYRTWMEALATLGCPFKTTDVTIKEVYERNIPLPFPLEQNDLFDGLKASSLLGLKYTGLNEGLARAFTIYKKIFY
jgi:dTDP-4-dehydrorhamnose reductase